MLTKFNAESIIVVKKRKKTTRRITDVSQRFKQPILRHVLFSSIRLRRVISLHGDIRPVPSNIACRLVRLARAI